MHRAGLNLASRSVSLHIIRWFVGLYSVFVAVSWMVMYAIGGRDAITGGMQSHTVAHAVQDILVFSLLPGPGEEPFFRMFVIRVLALTLCKERGTEDPVFRWSAIALSALLFSLGHVYIISWEPFAAQYSLVQMATALGLGVFYAWSYLKTGSLLAPVVCHNWSDCIVRFGGHLLAGFV